MTLPLANCKALGTGIFRSSYYKTLQGSLLQNVVAFLLQVVLQNAPCITKPTKLLFCPIHISKIPFSSCLSPFQFMFVSLSIHVWLPFSSCLSPFQFMFDSLSVHVWLPFSSCLSPFQFMFVSLSIHVWLPFSSCLTPYQFLFNSLSVHVWLPFNSCLTPFQFMFDSLRPPRLYLGLKYLPSMCFRARILGLDMFMPGYPVGVNFRFRPDCFTPLIVPANIFVRLIFPGYLSPP